jgi:hypothetical protein
MHRFKFALGTAGVVALLGLGLGLGVNAAAGAASNPYTSAHRVSNAPSTAPPSPVGTWTFCNSGGCPSLTWTFATGGGWSDSGGNSGSWIQQGTEISVDIQSGSSTSCFFLGKLITKTTPHTINSAAHPGPYDCGGSNFTWYAHQ